MNTKHVCQLSKIPSICKKIDFLANMCQECTDRMRKKEKFIDVNCKKAWQRIFHERLKANKKYFIVIQWRNPAGVSSLGSLGNSGTNNILQDKNVRYERQKASLVAQMVKNLPAMQETQDRSLQGRSPGERDGYPLQDSCLENPMERGAWQATAFGVT